MRFEEEMLNVDLEEIGTKIEENVTALSPGVIGFGKAIGSGVAGVVI